MTGCMVLQPFNLSKQGNSEYRYSLFVKVVSEMDSIQEAGPSTCTSLQTESGFLDTAVK